MHRTHWICMLYVCSVNLSLFTFCINVASISEALSDCRAMAQQSLTPRQARKFCESRELFRSIDQMNSMYSLFHTMQRQQLQLYCYNTWWIFMIFDAFCAMRCLCVMEYSRMMCDQKWGCVMMCDDIWIYCDMHTLSVSYLYTRSYRYVMILYVDIVIPMNNLYSFRLHVLIFMSLLIRNLLFCDRHMVRICQWSRRSQELESANLECLKALLLILHGRWIIFKVMSWDEQPSLD